MGEKTMKIKELMGLIPHRYPFLLIDRVIDYEEWKWIKAIKNLTINESFFQGHFPREPIMPGVLIIEAMAQAGGILALMSSKGKEKLAFFMTIDNVKFRKPVVPGDQLILNVAIVKVVRSNIVKTHGEATVDGELVAQGDLMFSVVDKEKT
ncbi:MAG: 3-hydroxyacyl-ACP dehydratase FabZ [Candidatus Omnitrophica bacterium]|nr:3-hydroxyacyl-ACP dehydratase FabZ [Candidatus Omnitrophota bacterium]MBU1128144.1 3-hydroxyacyl-ACP dehydratase FabZ [Candidatus Omnitrophota bacterium]MBU1656802.1 3-hydroxyacyl-ACP dehydratase FabZ [Candidatus Omnitrophota bacterium]MBU1784251.1 3-hydroxyacyl-ACP dehydratase FabZ [Candidatus Omnitrophota bacterium]MBU1851288.1 3-hydroxyacyl-ACP dehydratase FabZ [Candidatus Omnitrophota bacterium]